MKPLRECLLYTFVDTAYLHGRDPVEVARQLCHGGSDLIQIRAKGAPADQVFSLGEKIFPITRSAGVHLVINDHLEVARTLGAGVCHLGQEDFFDAGFNHISQLPGGNPDRPQIGLSTHAPAQAERAIRAGPDYIAIGPVFSTPTKPTAPAVTLEYVRWAAANVELPWFAIGGINLHTLPEVLAAGAKRICVVSAILNAPDIAQSCRIFRSALEAHQRSS